MAKSLHWLIEKGVVFNWTSEYKHAFNAMKTQLTLTPLLAHPEWSKPFLLDTDARGTGIGTALSQLREDGSEIVVTYICLHSPYKQERNYSTV